MSSGGSQLSLGIDTGGTYTDAVIVDAELRVIGSAKALTTTSDLSVGIGRAIDDVIAATRTAVGDVSMVALSTTLATNALVEGRTGKIAVVTMGLDDEGCRLAGIPDAVGADPWLRLDGGHDSGGAPLADPNPTAVDRFVATTGSVEGYAVAAQFSVRNPAHELMVRDRIAELSGRPVTCGHELSSALNGPARAVTCVLNARLIGVIDTMLVAAEQHLAKIGISAPVLVVRGDGSLMSVAVARKRPVETVLSGPAASVVGAVHLSKQPLGGTTAIVADIGGTTTDIALVRDGRPLISAQGAVVGGHQTMVAAIDIETTGLGGDSEVTIAGPALRLGPRRIIPISMLSAEFPEAVDAALSSDAEAKVSSARVARLVVLASPAEDLATRDATSRAILERLADGPVSWRELAVNHRCELALERLVTEGLVTPSGVTPTDAAHVLGLQRDFDTNAAQRALELMARQRDRFGEPIAASGVVLAQRIVDEVHALSATALLRTGLRTDGLDPNLAVSALAQMSRT
ncbi:MAG: hydantoinase/oxoprolinase family protein, partial [Actinobacteria bacterium]|nr:hydantoinase/oxoprolinase family protein [Actinomycetota bacterium]